MGRDWTFLTNHAHVLRCVVENPRIRLREIAERVDVTERTAHAILGQLEEAGYVSRARLGRRNEYTVRPELPLRHPLDRDHHVGDLLQALVGEPGDERAGYAAAVLEAAQDGIVVRGADGEILDVNRRFCEMTGRSSEELAGRRPPFPYWPAGSSDDLDMVEVLRRDAASERRMTFRRADGSPLEVIATAAPFRTEAGREGFVETFKEVRPKARTGAPAPGSH